MQNIKPYDSVCYPTLAVLPILGKPRMRDVEFATNIVTLSTVLFVIVIP